MDYLNTSPIFNYSKCSFENFYSRFICWLGNQYPHEVLRIFTEQDYSGSCVKFLPEEHHFDILVTIDGEEKIIIENKIKSLPNETQLESYKKRYPNAICVLLSFTEPSFGLKKLGWQYLDYKTLTDRINIDYKTDYDRFLTEDFINTIKNILDIFPKATTKYDFYSYDEKLNEYGLEDIYLKYRNSKFAKYLEESLDSGCSIDTDFSNKQAIVSVRKYFKNPDFEIGIQIQKYQYRYFFQYKDLESTQKVSQKLYEKGLWFFDTETFRKEFCCYKPRFVYRYKKLEENICFEEITQRIRQDMVRINFAKICEVLCQG